MSIDMKTNGTKYLDDEERDLDQAINEMDIARLEKPSERTQQQFKAAAGEHLKRNPNEHWDQSR